MKLKNTYVYLNFKTKNMKKVLLIAGLVTLTSSAFGQKATTDAPFSLEGLLNYNASTLSFSSPAVRARYFLSDNLALRLQVGLDNSATKSYHYELPNNEGAEGIAVDKNSMFWLGLGAEYHFKGTDRLSPYAGAQFNLGMGGSKTDYKNTDGTSYLADYTEKGKSPGIGFGGDLVAGVDIYLVQNLYMGLELGFHMSATTMKEGTTEITTGGTTTTTKTAMSKSSALNTGAIGTLRFGWRF